MKRKRRAWQRELMCRYGYSVIILFVKLYPVCIECVRTKRLELLRIAPLDPKSSASANFAMSAFFCKSQVVIDKSQKDCKYREKSSVADEAILARLSFSHYSASISRSRIKVICFGAVKTNGTFSIRTLLVSRPKLSLSFTLKRLMK